MTRNFEFLFYVKKISLFILVYVSIFVNIHVESYFIDYFLLMIMYIEHCVITKEHCNIANVIKPIIFYFHFSLTFYYFCWCSSFYYLSILSTSWLFKIISTLSNSSFKLYIFCIDRILGIRELIWLKALYLRKSKHFIVSHTVKRISIFSRAFIDHGWPIILNNH